MIRSFKHKGLEAFFRTGSKAGIQPSHAPKLTRILAALEFCQDLREMNAPGWNLHQLSGSLAQHFAVTVSGNWRVTFKFQNGGADLVDYQDYH